MDVPKRKFREAVLLLLFAPLFTKENPCEMDFLMSEQLKLKKDTLDEALKRAKEIFDQAAKIDHLIESTSHAYEISRICKVELSVLRLCVFELLFEKKLPKEIVIAEGIRLAKKFSTKESAHFVHAMLDSLVKRNLSDEKTRCADLAK